eukprot:4885052-Pleurochrysis_carterae.AAC.1
MRSRRGEVERGPSSIRSVVDESSTCAGLDLDPKHSLSPSCVGLESVARSFLIHNAGLGELPPGRAFVLEDRSTESSVIRFANRKKCVFGNALFATWCATEAKCQNPPRHVRMDACAPHAAEDESGAVAFSAGYTREGASVVKRACGDCADGGVPDDSVSLHALQLYVVHPAAKEAWPYPRAPPLIAVAVPRLLPQSQREVTKLVLCEAAAMADARAKDGDTAPFLYDVVCWLRAQLPALLQRLSLLTPRAVAENEGGEGGEGGA